MFNFSLSSLLPFPVSPLNFSLFNILLLSLFVRVYLPVHKYLLHFSFSSCNSSLLSLFSIPFSVTFSSSTPPNLRLNWKPKTSYNKFRVIGYFKIVNKILYKTMLFVILPKKNLLKQVINNEIKIEMTFNMKN